MANKSVVLYQSIKVGRRWIFRAVDEDSKRFSEGPFYVSWYDGKEKQMDPVGRDPEHALSETQLRRAALAYVAAGGEIKSNIPAPPPVQPDQSPAPERKSVATAITEYLADCLERQGKSGYGLAPRTHESYEYRLGVPRHCDPNHNRLSPRNGMIRQAARIELITLPLPDLPANSVPWAAGERDREESEGTHVALAQRDLGVPGLPRCGLSVSSFFQDLGCAGSSLFACPLTGDGGSPEREAGTGGTDTASGRVHRKTEG